MLKNTWISMKMKFSIAVVIAGMLVGFSVCNLISSEENFKSGKNKDELLFAHVVRWQISSLFLCVLFQIYRNFVSTDLSSRWVCYDRTWKTNKRKNLLTILSNLNSLIRKLLIDRLIFQTGKREMFKLGEYFHRRYRNILGERYSPEKIYTISTDFDRSIMSAQANLAGMFIPRRDEMWNADIMWQPVPVHTISQKRDRILRPRYKDRCPKYGVMYDYYMQKSPYALDMKAKFGKFFEYWAKMSNDAIHTIEDVFSIYKRIIADRNSGKKWVFLFVWN